MDLLAELVENKLTHVEQDIKSFSRQLVILNAFLKNKFGKEFTDFADPPGGGQFQFSVPLPSPSKRTSSSSYLVESNKKTTKATRKSARILQPQKRRRLESPPTTIGEDPLALPHQSSSPKNYNDDFVENSRLMPYVTPHEGDTGGLNVSHEDISSRDVKFFIQTVETPAADEYQQGQEQQDEIEENSEGLSGIIPEDSPATTHTPSDELAVEEESCQPVLPSEIGNSESDESIHFDYVYVWPFHWNESEGDDLHKGNKVTPRKSPKTSSNNFRCPMCNASFGTPARLAFHRKLHGHESDIRLRKNQCYFCSSSFIWFSHLEDHLRLHTKEEPFSCPVCSKSFRQQSSMKAHVRIHTNEKPYACALCPKVFRVSSNLRSHERIHMSKVGDLI